MASTRPQARYWYLPTFEMGYIYLFPDFLNVKDLADGE